LRAAGCERIWTDKVSGKLAHRPEWDKCQDYLRHGDELVITRLARVFRSVRHLTELAAQLHERGIELVVLKQGIDTTTPIGRFAFHMLAAMDEFLADLISEGTLEGLESARARGRTGGRPAGLTPKQVAVARQMYDEVGEDGKRAHTVAEIAEVFAVSRKTIYRHLDPTGRRQPDKTARPTLVSVDTGEAADQPSPVVDLAGLRPKPARIRQAGEPVPAAERELVERLTRQREKMRASRCPSCGNEPMEAQDRWQQRQDLAIVWLYADPDHPGDVVEKNHCAHCQPHQHFATIVCPLCGDGPMLAGDLADLTSDPAKPPEPVRQWLGQQGWHDDPDDGRVCGQH
jgi:DNA invertase Pin-like site-specific DNA recombinase